MIPVWFPSEARSFLQKDVVDRARSRRRLLVQATIRTQCFAEQATNHKLESDSAKVESKRVSLCVILMCRQPLGSDAQPPHPRVLRLIYCDLVHPNTL